MIGAVLWAMKCDLRLSVEAVDVGDLQSLSSRCVAPSGKLLPLPSCVPSLPQQEAAEMDLQMKARSREHLRIRATERVRGPELGPESSASSLANVCSGETARRTRPAAQAGPQRRHICPGSYLYRLT